jgi:photosystem II stability/assembly factor-like uncharacterized protein
MALRFLLVLSFLFFSNCIVKSQQYGWYPQNSTTTYGLSGIDFINVNTGWITGGGSSLSPILKTTNSGNSWQLISAISNITIADIDFINEDTGWVCGYDGMDPKIYRSTNGGYNWVSQTVPEQALFFFYTIKFISDTLGLCAGELGQILRTTNGGINWTMLPNPSQYDNINDIFFINSSTGWLAGGYESGCIYKTTDSGVNWVRYGFYFRAFNSVWFLDSLRGFGVGSDGMLHGMINRTSNSGASWNEQYIYSSESVNSVWFLDTLRGRVTSVNSSYEGTVYNTTNGAATWNYELYSPHSLGKLFFVDSINGWVIGGYGDIYKYGDITGIKQLSGVPDHLSLSQNYPNPFNPVTKIKFDIPASLNPPFAKGVTAKPGGFVRLVVYDLLGREISVLVNERLTPGSFEVEWDGSNYPSGVYFYRLTTDGFTETKRMVLIR